jgi:hypothetical protein
LTPYCETIEQNLIFVFLAADDSRVICELKPMDRVARYTDYIQSPKAKLGVFLRFYVLNECAKGHMEQERTETVTL